MQCINLALIGISRFPDLIFKCMMMFSKLVFEGTSKLSNSVQLSVKMLKKNLCFFLESALKITAHFKEFCPWEQFIISTCSKRFFLSSAVASFQVYHPFKFIEGLCQGDFLFPQADMECLRKHIRDYRMCLNSEPYIMICLPIEMGWFNKCVKQIHRLLELKNNLLNAFANLCSWRNFANKFLYRASLFYYLFFVSEEPLWESRWLVV